MSDLHEAYQYQKDMEYRQAYQYQKDMEYRQAKEQAEQLCLRTPDRQCLICMKIICGCEPCAPMTYPEDGVA